MKEFIRKLFRRTRPIDLFAGYPPLDPKLLRLHVSSATYSRRLA